MPKTFVPTPSSPPPARATPAALWLRQNFFNSPLSILMTALGFFLLWSVVPSVINWAFLEATWGGDSRSICDASPGGACWTALHVRLWQVMTGLYYGANKDQLWRPLVVFVAFCLIVVLLLGDFLPLKRRVQFAVLVLSVFPVVTFGLLHGAMFGLPIAPTSQWGGFMLTLVLAAGGIVIALPIGILLALGRRSQMRVIQWFCVVFIEFWRANPLITILFMASSLLPLFLPSGVELDKVGRALVAITLFQSAYTAEAIRGGLAAIPRGQFEAADALALKYPQKTALIILP